MRLTALLGLILPCLFALGCGGDSNGRPTSGSGDTVRINSLVLEFTDVGGVPAFNRYFAAGSKMTDKDLKKFSQFSYKLDGTPAVSGDTATAKVKVLKDTQELSTQEWSFVKEGDAWKIKNAPLP
jgi:hypothetical protein